MLSEMFVQLSVYGMNDVIDDLGRRVYDAELFGVVLECIAEE